jgi:hypothetical protein
MVRSLFLCENLSRNKKGAQKMPYNPPGYYPQYYPNTTPYADQLTQLKAQPMYQPAQQNTGNLLWVQGEAGAKSYLIAPGNTLVLMDSEAERFYIKSVEPNGIPQTRTFEYREITNAPAAQPTPTAQPVDHVTHDELNRLREEFRSEMQRITELVTKKPIKRGAIETDE